jgi:RND family efflux transporter MFP subunit
VIVISLAKRLSSIRLWVFVFIILGFVGFVWISVQPKQLVSSKGISLKKAVVIPKNIENIISLSGTVDANEKVTLQFQTSGRLAWVGVKEGDVVKKGQIIASLDQRNIRKNLEKDLKDFSNQRLSFDQFRDDNKSKNIGSPNTYLTDQLSRLAEQNQNTLDKTVINVELDSLSLELSNLITPISGIITHIDQKVAGLNITPATARFEVVNPDSLYILGTVDQQDIARIKQNASASIVFDALPNSVHYGKVSYIAFSPEAGDDNAYSIKISIPQKIIPQLRLSMGAEVSITTDTRKKVLSVPLEAIIDEGNKKYVLVLAKEKQEKRRVFIGLETDNDVEIIKGLRANETVVY